MNPDHTALRCFVCVDALRPSQQLFSCVGMFSCLPGLNQYYSTKQRISKVDVTCFIQQDSLQGSGGRGGGGRNGLNPE